MRFWLSKMHLTFDELGFFSVKNQPIFLSKNFIMYHFCIIFENSKIKKRVFYRLCSCF